VKILSNFLFLIKKLQPTKAGDEYFAPQNILQTPRKGQPLFVSAMAGVFLESYR
jgi:hypothetical protein